MPPPMFELMYHKSKNLSLFETLENANTGLHNLQNYVPLYRRFFSLSDANYNNINLNHKYHIKTVKSGTSKNNVIAVFDSDEPLEAKNVFIKYSPLLDPIKYLSGKYDMQSPDLMVIPSYTSTNDVLSVHQKKMNDPNNSSYVDSFFTYLTSQVLETHGFVHGVEFYGSFLSKSR